MSLSDFVNRSKSIEDLESCRWPSPPPETTSLVRGVHELRKCPIRDLTVDNIRRLISQDVGLRWILPVALDYLRETAPQGAETGWYDDDLLSAVLTRRESTWRASPEMARHLDGTVKILTDLTSYIQEEVDDFRRHLSDLLGASPA